MVFHQVFHIDEVFAAAFGSNGVHGNGSHATRDFGKIEPRLQPTTERTGRT